MKLKAGVYTLTSCQGCQLNILNLGDELLDVLDYVSFERFPWINEKNSDGPFDIVFIDGSVSNAEEEKTLKNARTSSKILVALGNCACHGGVQLGKNFLSDTVKVENLRPRNVRPVSDFVKVDYFLYGCPMIPAEFVNLINCIKSGREFRQKTFPVCFECARNNNDCLLLNNEFCMGPITRGGCNSVCLNNNNPCDGCRGVFDDANMKSFLNLLKNKNFKPADIQSLMSFYGGLGL